MSAAGLMVRFNSADEFLAELDQRQTRLVRVTREFRGTRFHPIRDLYVIATCLTGDPALPVIVRLDAYCGQTIEGGDEADKRADALLGRIVDKLVERSIQTGAGIFEYQA